MNSMPHTVVKCVATCAGGAFDDNDTLALAETCTAWRDALAPKLDTMWQLLRSDAQAVHTALALGMANGPRFHAAALRDDLEAIAFPPHIVARDVCLYNEGNDHPWPSKEYQPGVKYPKVLTYTVSYTLVIGTHEFDITNDYDYEYEKDDENNALPTKFVREYGQMHWNSTSGARDESFEWGQDIRKVERLGTESVKSSVCCPSPIAQHCFGVVAAVKCAMAGQEELDRYPSDPNMAAWVRFAKARYAADPLV
jgi:hypothetical protein